MANIRVLVLNGIAKKTFPTFPHQLLRIGVAKTTTTSAVHRAMTQFSVDLQKPHFLVSVSLELYVCPKPVLVN